MTGMDTPIGYVISTFVLVPFVLFAVAPPRPRHSSPSNRSYWFGFLLNELPFVAFYWLAASTGLALSEGAAHSWLGRSALVVAAGTTVGLAVVAWRGFRARRAVDTALEAAFGPRWRGSIDPDLVRRLRRRPPLARVLFTPFSVRRRSVERVANISYGDAGRLNLLDVYRHRSRPSGCPTLVYLHGGSFRSGRKNNEARALLYRLASQGWLCISANHRLSPAAQFPDHLIDAKKVIAWVRTNGPEYGADPTLLFVSGSSAGGNLAATAALTPNEPRFQPGFEQVDTSVTAAVSLYGYYGCYSGSAASSPASYVREDAPPFFIAHGDRDTMALARDARAFARTLRSTSSNPVVYAELPGGQHTFDLFESLRFASVVDGIEAFAARIRSRGCADAEAGARVTRAVPLGGRS
jgi:acetyl esterase/lipase